MNIGRIVVLIGVLMMAMNSCSQEAPKGKLIYCSYINHGVYHDNVFTFNNHELNNVFFGSILPEANGFDNPGWFIGNSHESVTEEEYTAALNEDFDMDSSQSINSGQHVEN